MLFLIIGKINTPFYYYSSFIYVLFSHFKQTYNYNLKKMFFLHVQTYYKLKLKKKHIVYHTCVVKGVYLFTTYIIYISIKYLKLKTLENILLRIKYSVNNIYYYRYVVVVANNIFYV